MYDKMPDEFGIEGLIDWDRHFERGMMMPLTQIFDALDWEMPDVKHQTNDIDDLFE